MYTILHTYTHVYAIFYIDPTNMTKKSNFIYISLLGKLISQILVISLTPNLSYNSSLAVKTQQSKFHTYSLVKSGLAFKG